MITIQNNILITGNASLGKGLTLQGNVEVVEKFETEKEKYKGPYSVIPDVTLQVLNTKDLAMEDDVTVHEIPYKETSNEHGITVSIAS